VSAFLCRRCVCWTVSFSTLLSALSRRPDLYGLCAYFVTAL
jgi:hypothetical protein